MSRWFLVELDEQGGDGCGCVAFALVSLALICVPGFIILTIPSVFHYFEYGDYASAYGIIGSLVCGSIAAVVTSAAIFRNQSVYTFTSIFKACLLSSVSISALVYFIAFWFIECHSGILDFLLLAAGSAFLCFCNMLIPSAIVALIYVLLKKHRSQTK